MKRRAIVVRLLLAVSAGSVLAVPAAGYPLDGYETTGIRRLLAYRRVQDGQLPGSFKLPPGARLGQDAIRLHLAGVDETFDVGPGTALDPDLQAGLERLLSGRDPSYRVALVDLSDPSRPRFAAVRPDDGYIPGSVGKLLVMTALFDQLAKRFPGDTEARSALLRAVEITADAFVMPSSHTVPIVNEDATSLEHRAIRLGDRFTLWEWLDHMVSPSSNAAGSMVWKQALLMSVFGDAYPPTAEQEARFFADTPPSELAERSVRLLEEPLSRFGLDTEKLHLRTFFTAGASRLIPGRSSYAVPRELVRWLVRLEQGKLVDAWSSLEMKRLLYFTRRRYRYASAPALSEARVYFKSGSLYRCRPEPDYQCAQYEGNETNLMHSVAIVESPSPLGDKVYLVSVMSNVLKVNSANEHREIAGQIERLVQALPQAPPPGNP
jgi:hypothetical protein